jgi:hypothetical protein
MIEKPAVPDNANANAMEADLARRKAEHQATTHANGLGRRLAEVDVHQREARYILERAGMLTRRKDARQE